MFRIFSRTSGFFSGARGIEPLRKRPVPRVSFHAVRPSLNAFRSVTLQGCGARGVEPRRLSYAFMLSRSLYQLSGRACAPVATGGTSRRFIASQIAHRSQPAAPAGGRVSFCHSKQARLAPFSYLYTRVLARTRCKYTEFL